MSIFFSIKYADRTRDHNLKITKTSCKVDARKYKFSRRVEDKWNILNHETGNAKTTNRYKKLLDRQLYNIKYEFLDNLGITANTLTL